MGKVVVARVPKTGTLRSGILRLDCRSLTQTLVEEDRSVRVEHPSSREGLMDR